MEIKIATCRVKNFYMRAIGLIIIITDFDEVNQLLKCIFIVSTNEENGIDINEKSIRHVRMLKIN